MRRQNMFSSKELKKYIFFTNIWRQKHNSVGKYCGKDNFIYAILDCGHGNGLVKMIPKTPYKNLFGSVFHV